MTLIHENNEREMPESSSQPNGEGAGFQPIDLPEGTFFLDEALDDRIRAGCAAAARTGDEAHPIFAFVGGLGGLGVPVANAMALAGCSIDDGPLLASCEIDLHRIMKVGVTYQIAGRVVEKRRKGSRRYGAADHLLFSIHIGHGGNRFADLHLRMIFPVRNA